MKRELSLDEIKKIELNLLIEFREICNKLGLRYYIFGGTLLGAIRHKGFIPWDDDIDVCMPRPDYDKLMKFSETYKNENNKFLFYKDYNNMAHFIRFVDLRTHILQEYNDNEMYKHIWMDIMPLDGLPENFDELKQIYKKAHFYRTIFGLCDAILGYGTSFRKRILKYILKPIALLYTRQRALNNLNKLSIRYDYDISDYVGAISMGLYGTSERMLKLGIGEGCEVEFENEKFNTFCCWDSYLKSLYKDYMQLPPIEKRKNHHFKAWLEEQTTI